MSEIMTQFTVVFIVPFFNVITEKWGKVIVRRIDMCENCFEIGAVREAQRIADERDTQCTIKARGETTTVIQSYRRYNKKQAS